MIVLLHSKLVNGLLLVALPGIQHNAGEVGAVRCVGEVLALEANG